MIHVNIGYVWAKFLQLINCPALKNCHIDKRASVGAGSNCINVRMGRYSYMGKNNSVCNASIGSFCSIASYCAIGGGDHPLDYVSTSPVFYGGRNRFGINFGETEPAMNQNVEIGNDVWIGEGAFICAGVRIGNGAVIGAHSVVTHDVEPYSVVAGVPARLLRKRFDDDCIQSLQRSEWWTWDDAKLRRLGGSFDNVHKFIDQLKKERTNKVDNY